MAFSGSTSSIPSSEINITPLIDVLLVLLIIFMVIVPRTPRGLGSQVPQAQATETGETPLRVSVRDAAEGGLRYELDGRTIARSELSSRLRSWLARRQVPGVFVTASPAVGYQAVAEVVSEARSAGATSVILGRQ